MKTFNILFVLFLISFSCKSPKEKTTVHESKTQSFEVKINGMTCSGCEQTIENVVSSLSGVKSVDVSHVSGNALISVDPDLADTLTIRKKIDETGYTTVAILSKSGKQ